MRVILAPMQGVLDAFMREILTQSKAYDLCVTEFVRVVESLLPDKTYYRLCPELHHQGYTKSGTPVRVQLLGQHPDWLAENAVRAINLGSHGIDLNCGCPSKTVNGSQGGASLLKDPDLIYRATLALRKALGKENQLSVKVRLGWDSPNHAFEIADAVEQGGADEIAIHGRTKADGYKAEAINWQKIGECRQRLNIPVIANGEIFTFSDGVRCREITGCTDLMVARGALNVPNLAQVLKENAPILAWEKVQQLLLQYAQVENRYDTGFYHVARIKQWLQYLKKAYPQAETLFDAVKHLKSADELRQALANF